MATITDPYDLKPGEVYRQARTVASKTSRGTDGNWYRDPGDIACQWHIWFDGGREVCSATFSRSDNCWRQGPPLPLAGLTTGEDVHSLLGDLLSPTYFGHKPKALGVILHVADEFSLSEVAGTSEAAGENADDFNVLRYNLVDSPKDFLADRDVSIDTVSWRLLPFWGAPSGESRCTAVAMPRSRETFLNRLVEGGEEWRIPVRVAVTSAPMEALAALALLKPELRGGGLIAFPYLKYTAVFALTAQGELRSARSLAHRGGNPIPSSFGDILWNMAVSAELIANDGAGQLLPNLLVISPNQGILSEAVRELESYSLKRQRIVAHAVDLSTHPTTANLPGHRPEFLPYDVGAASQAGSAGSLSQSETFRSLWDGWATQNFFNTAKIDTLYPTLADLRLLRFSSWFVGLLGISLLALGGYGIYGLFTAMRHPSWTLTEDQVQKTKTQHEKLFAEEKQIDITERLMKPRSQGWSTLELMLQMFPEDSGVRLENFAYEVKPGASQQVSRKGAKSAPAAAGGIQTVGFVREWTFKGLAKAKTLDILNNLNSQRGLNAFFEEVAKATGDVSLVPDPSRQVRLVLTQNQNPRYNVTASVGEAAKEPALTYPYAFEAVISQTIAEKDPLALPTGKPF